MQCYPRLTATPSAAGGHHHPSVLLWKIQPAPAVPALPQPRKPGCPTSKRRHARDRRRREAWAERRLNHSQPCLHTQSAEKTMLPRQLQPVLLRLQMLPLHLPQSSLSHHLSRSRCRPLSRHNQLSRLGNRQKHTLRRPVPAAVLQC